MAAAPDWYPDPASPETSWRWWDGERWTEHTQPMVVEPTVVEAPTYVEPEVVQSIQQEQEVVYTGYTPGVTAGSTKAFSGLSDQPVMFEKVKVAQPEPEIAAGWYVSKRGAKTARYWNGFIFTEDTTPTMGGSYPVHPDLAEAVSRRSAEDRGDIFGKIRKVALVSIGVVVVGFFGLVTIGVVSSITKVATEPFAIAESESASEPVSDPVPIADIPTQEPEPEPVAEAPPAPPPPPPPTTDPKFKTCAEANAAGYGNYVKGVDAEYSWYRDGDKDGVVCEF